MVKKAFKKKSSVLEKARIEKLAKVDLQNYAISIGKELTYASQKLGGSSPTYTNDQLLDFGIRVLTLCEKGILAKMVTALSKRDAAGNLTPDDVAYSQACTEAGLSPVDCACFRKVVEAYVSNYGPGTISW